MVERGKEVATTARRQTRSVNRTAAREARAIEGTVRLQARDVRDEVVSQTRSVLDEAKARVEEQTRFQARRAAGSLAEVAAEAQALVDGRPQDAETVCSYLDQGADRLLDLSERIQGLADQVDARGLESLLEDLQAFARRRPVPFLLGAAVAGFGVGRAIRSAQADTTEGSEAPADGRRSGDTGYRRRAS